MPRPKLAPFLRLPYQPLGAILLLFRYQMLEGLPAQRAGKTAQLLSPEALPVPVFQLASVRPLLLAHCLGRGLPGGDRRLPL